MAEPSTMNSCSGANEGETIVNDHIKQEVEVAVKREPVECLVCVDRSPDSYDIHNTKTLASGMSLYDVLCKVSHFNLSNSENCPKYVCKACYELVNELERAEIEYKKLKETFEAIISKNPFFESRIPTPTHCTVKNEMLEVYNEFCKSDNDDSEDEPLALTKNKRVRKVDKRKKKSSIESKRKPRQKSSKDSWECKICGIVEDSGGTEGLEAHVLAAHNTSKVDTEIKDVKKEEETDDFLQTSDTIQADFKLQIEEFDDDDDSPNFVPEELHNGKQNRGNKSKLSMKTTGPKKRRKREDKVLHQCDQCDAKYTSLLRLEQHKQKHDDSKPPYICEVCGAHYKHKRACDIHVALHKGISDWKCEECNKLFPSKGALQRHNNIHTGKLNYQCDLCGKSFIHTSSFKMHKLSHTGVKSHACDVCGLALMTRSHLKRHKRIHSGEKRHECTVCGKRFSERYNLLAHSKSHEAVHAGAALCDGAWTHAGTATAHTAQHHEQAAQSTGRRAPHARSGIQRRTKFGVAIFSSRLSDTPRAANDIWRCIWRGDLERAIRAALFPLTFRAKPCSTVPCRTTPCRITSCRTTPCRHVPFHTSSYVEQQTTV